MDYGMGEARHVAMNAQSDDASATNREHSFINSANSAKCTSCCHGNNRRPIRIRAGRWQGEQQTGRSFSV